MCGIAGAYASRPMSSTVSRMSACLLHRGPDDYSETELRTANDEPAGMFSHHRLAIIDTTHAGRQPMVTADGRFAITFNGEIYNYRELRQELEAAGAQFRSHSDTEVLLLGWSMDGPGFITRLRGMFAFALWDKAKGTGYLVRDPFGIKPLYWARCDDAVLFASEVRAVLRSGEVARYVSPAAVEAYLAVGSVPEPLTMVEGVEALPAGTMVEVLIRGDHVTVTAPRRYVAEPAGEEQTWFVQDRGEAAQLLRQALRDSVAHHLVSDVPVGLFLSGGIDSSALAATASECAQAPLDSFTITFAEREYSEAGPARLVAERFGMRHHEVPLRAQDCLASIPEAFAAMDQPTIDGLNTFFISRAVRERGIKVALSGVGGDELFGGYPSFVRARHAARLHRLLPLPLRKSAAAAARTWGARGEKLAALVENGSPASAAYQASRMLFGQRQLQALLSVASKWSMTEAPSHLSLLRQVSYHEMTGYMRNTLLRDTDTFSMAHGLEVRVPFLDPAVVRVAFAVAGSDWLDSRQPKSVLVDAVRDLLPRTVWDRPKQGFALPLQRWLAGEMRSEVASVFQSRAAVEAVGLRPAAVGEIWRDYLAGRRRASWSRPWALYTLVRWARENHMRWPQSDGRMPRAARPAGVSAAEAGGRV
jgi:asparagine synthase (glutamine-hydrolysing)